MAKLVGGNGKILVLGATGQIGYEAVRELAPLGAVVGLTRSDVDLAEPDALRQIIRELRPRIVVNAAAYTAVDRAESEPDLCAAINADAPAVLADECRRLDALLVHYSTDYVFDGRSTVPYVETDDTAPLNVYGATKLAGEQAIRASGVAHVVLRTSWVYGARGSNFLRSILRLARQQPEIRVVDDQIGAPTWSRAVATATALMIQALGHAAHTVAELGHLAGTYHVTAAGQASWFDFARAIVEQSQNAAGASARVVAIPTTSYPTAATRPPYSVLDNSKLASRFAIALPDWREQLRLALPEALGVSP